MAIKNANKKTTKKTASKVTKKTTKKAPVKKASNVNKTIAKKASSKKSTPKCTPEMKERILDTLVDSKGNPRPQVHVDDIASATGASVPDVTTTLMVLELEHKVKSLPGRYFRLPVVDETRKSRQSDGKTKSSAGRTKGKMSMLDAAADILKSASQPLCCKEIVTAIFQKKLAESEGRTPHATLSAAMGREIAKLGSASRFRRTGRGLYELNA